MASKWRPLGSKYAGRLAKISLCADRVILFVNYSLNIHVMRCKAFRLENVFRIQQNKLNVTEEES